jgi:hypothetical protein
MEFSFSNPLFEWRGPSPFYFVAIPQEDSEGDLIAVALDLGRKK